MTLEDEFMELLKEPISDKDKKKLLKDAERLEREEQPKALVGITAAEIPPCEWGNDKDNYDQSNIITDEFGNILRM